MYDMGREIKPHICTAGNVNGNIGLGTLCLLLNMSCITGEMFVGSPLPMYVIRVKVEWEQYY